MASFVNVPVFLLVLQIGNFWVDDPEFIVNDPSNPQQPIHSLRETPCVSLGDENHTSGPRFDRAGPRKSREKRVVQGEVGLSLGRAGGNPRGKTTIDHWVAGQATNSWSETHICWEHQSYKNMCFFGNMVFGEPSEPHLIPCKVFWAMPETYYDWTWLEQHPLKKGRDIEFTKKLGGFSPWNHN